jgi:hypothetical protein
MKLQTRISARRARALAQISGLLLHTLPVIAAERAAGIIYIIPNSSEPDPTKKPS